MLGSLAYIAPLFGPDTLLTIEEQLISTADRFFSTNVVNEIIEPTVRDIVQGARGEVVSAGLCDLAVGGIVGDLVVRRCDRRGPRPDARCATRCASGSIALGLYVVMLVLRDRDAHRSLRWAPQDRRVSPGQLGQRAAFGYYPVLFVGLVVAVNILYRVSLPKPLPSHRLLWGSVLAAVVFLVATFGLRVYLTWITSTGLHLRRAGDADRVPAVRVLPGLLDHAGRRTQRRDRGGVAGAGHARTAASGLAGAEGRVAQQRRRWAGQTGCPHGRRRWRGLGYFLRAS